MKPEELPPSARQWIRDVLEAALADESTVGAWCHACDDDEHVTVNHAEFPEAPWVYEGEIRKFAKWLEDL